jgi:hypothetical protein
MVIHSRASMCIRLLLLVIFLGPLPALCQQKEVEAHGTCAIFISNARNMAFVVDSALTETNNSGEVTGHGLACKTWLPSSKIVAVTTGLFKDGPMFTGWDSQAKAKVWLRKLSADPTVYEIDTALRGWSRQLLEYLTGHPQIARLQKEGEIASLVVGFNVGSINHIFRERVIAHEGRALRDESESLRHAVPPQGDDLVYAGSCRNYIGVHGVHGIQISESEMNHLNKLADYMKSTRVNSAQQLGMMAVEYEQALISINRNNVKNPANIDAIGPPIQLATLPLGSNEWTVSFVAPCTD